MIAHKDMLRWYEKAHKPLAQMSTLGKSKRVEGEEEHDIKHSQMTT
jgi:hypothetical protein